MTIIYDPTLVMLAVFVAIIGSLTGLVFTFGYNVSMFLPVKSLMKGAVIIGGSIWSMHFIAMLAVKFPVVVDYNSAETLLSLCVAVLFTGAGLSIASARRFGLLRIPAAGVVMGSGIAGMHYLGMSAIRGCGLSYDFKGVALSVAVAIGASATALWFAFRERSAVETLLGGVVLGLAISGMHYTAMYATSYYPISISLGVETPLLSPAALALSVAGATLAICSIYLFLFSSMLIREG